MFTLIPYVAHSAASERAMCKSAVLLTLYATCGCGKLTRCPLMLAISTIDPPVPCSFIILPAACAHRKPPVVLTSSVRRHSCSLRSIACSQPTIPAKQASMSTEPNFSRTYLNVRSTSVPEVTSHSQWVTVACGNSRRKVPTVKPACERFASSKAMPDAPCSSSARAACVARLPPPPVTVYLLSDSAEQQYLDIYSLMALPFTANRASAFSECDNQAGSGCVGGVFELAEPSDNCISGNCRFFSSSRSVFVVILDGRVLASSQFVCINSFGSLKLRR